MNNRKDCKTAEKKDRDIEKKKFKKHFEEPVLKVYEPLVDITLFTSSANVSGGTFF